MPILINLSVILMIQGNPVEAVLILKKLHRYAPDNLFVAHNVIFAQLMDGWFKDTFDTFRIFIDGISEKKQLSDIEKLVIFSKENVERVIKQTIETGSFPV
jgi:hypothetical protein